MKTELRNDISKNKTLLILSIWCILAGLSSFVIGEAATVFVSAILAAVFVFENGRTRTYSIIASAILIAINLVMLGVMQSVISLWSLTSILCALVISLCYKKATSVFDCSLVLTFIISAFTVISLIMVGMLAAKEFSFEAAKDYYFKLYQLFRDKISLIMVDIYAQINQSIGRGGITYEQASAVIDTVLSLMIGVLIVISFIMCGAAIKIFRSLMVRYSQSADEAKSWRFVPPAFFGHFYIILVLAHFIFSGSNGLAAITIANLYMIFMWIYAYVGAKVFYLILTQKKSKAFAVFMIILGVFLLSSLATQILAMLGAFYTSRSIPESPSDK